MPRTIIRAYCHALPRRYAEERILPSFRANEPLRSLYPLFFCATATDAPCGTKVKGFSKRQFLPLEKKRHKCFIRLQRFQFLLSDTGNAVREFEYDH